jgi:short-subunit dehydrogenase
VAIVTGAGSGIGRALSLQLARSGARLQLVDIDADGLDSLAVEIEASGAEAIQTIADVADAQAVEKLVAATVRRYNRLDFLFNNGAVGSVGTVEDHSIERWRRLIDVNLLGVVHGVAAAYPRMIRQGFGHIINTASVAGLVPVPNIAPYAATKHAVVGLSLALRVEGARRGVRVSVACPGIVDTPLLRRAPDLRPAREVDDRQQWLERFSFLAWEPSRCASAILDGVARNRALILVTGHGRLLRALHRVAPRWVERGLGRLILGARRSDRER